MFGGVDKEFFSHALISQAEQHKNWRNHIPFTTPLELPVVAR